MFLFSNFNILILLITRIGLVLVSSVSQDHLCSSLNNILCVKDVLSDILSASNEISVMAQEMKQSIYKSDRTGDTLGKYINHNIKHFRADLSSEHHYQLMHVNNNINRTGFIELIQEENNAFSYLYNSMQNILKRGNTLGISIDHSFNKTMHLLRKDILCNYRHILYVYSGTWLSLHQINGIPILNIGKNMAPSSFYRGDAIIVTRLLQEWTKNVHDFVGNIETKIYL